MRRALARVGLLLLAALLWSGPLTAQERGRGTPAGRCLVPPVRSLFPEPASYVYPELAAKSLRLGEGAGRVQWLAASWFGPMQGRLFALDCAGKLLGRLEDAGFMRQLKAGPVIAGVGPTVLLESTMGTGTGFREDMVRVIGLADGAARVLWEHTSLKTDAGSPATAFEEKWGWKFSPDGTRVAVTGARTEAGKRGRAVLPKAAYCWDDGKRAFGKC